MIIPILVLAGLIDLAVLAKLHSAFRMLHVPHVDVSANSTVDLPSVSICITARNETHAMTQCLERVIASDYPKLEVIVLDDGSRDNTSVLIKSFAHAGVRFVEGKQLPDGWLGKNYAQSLLADEASGKYVMYIDVDTLIDRFTVRRAVEYMLQHQAKMISIIPIRDDTWTASTLMTTMRHFWTIMMFRPSLPRAAANAWLIDREVLVDQLAKDTTLPMSVQLETTIARDLAKGHLFRLVLSSKWLGLRYEKKWPSQVETSIRLLYPQCGKNPLRVLSLIAILMILLIPYVVVWWQPWAFAIIVSNYIVAYYYVRRVWSRYRLVGALLMPLTVMQEIVLLIVSMYRYHFGTITWKGRPITTRDIT